MKPIINRKAKFDYELLDSYEAGICLYGSEVKSIRESAISFADSFCYMKDGEIWIKNLVLSKVSKNSDRDHDPNRDKKLLLKKREIRKISKSNIKGTSIIPSKIYSNSRNIIKVEISIGRGKKDYDKKKSIMERDIKKETNYTLKYNS